MDQTLLECDRVNLDVDKLFSEYCDAVKSLARATSFTEIVRCIKNIDLLWRKLASVISEAPGFESFQEEIRRQLQSEVAALEKVYLKINLQIEFNERGWTGALWTAAGIVLKRMDAVLNQLQVSKEHADRRLVQELESRNREKKRKWLKSKRLQ